MVFYSLAKVPVKTDILASSHSNSSLLASSEQKLLNDVVHAYKMFRVVPHSEQIFHTLSSASSLTSYSVNNIFGSILHSCFQSMHLFISSSPDFRVLTLAEQSSLYQRNLHTLVSFYSIFALRDVFVSNHVNYLEVCTAIHGEEMALLMRSFHTQSHFDLTFVALMFMILSFSSNCCLVDVHRGIHRDSLLFGTHRLLGSQNAYVELMWNYLNNRCGYRNSIHQFIRVMGLFLNVIERSTTTYQRNQSYHQMINDIMEQIEPLLAMNQNEAIPLWGRLYM